MTILCIYSRLSCSFPSGNTKQHNTEFRTITQKLYSRKIGSCYMYAWSTMLKDSISESFSQEILLLIQKNIYTKPSTSIIIHNANIYMQGPEMLNQVSVQFKANIDIPLLTAYSLSCKLNLLDLCHFKIHTFKSFFKHISIFITVLTT